MPASIIPVSGMQLGFVGQISNEGYSLRVPRQVSPTAAHNVAFGEVVVVQDDNTIISMADFIAGGGVPDADTPMGIAVSNVHTNTTFAPGTPTAPGFYAPGQIADVLVQGTINVQVNVGAAGDMKSQGTVYLRKTANGAIPAGIVGGLEAKADAANTVALTNMKFKTGKLGADGTAQVTILNRTIA